MDCARNIITANFSGGGTSATTAPLWQWDYGQMLCIIGLEDLPAAFEVHFSTNRTGGVSTTAVGADGQVTIPNMLLTIGKNLNAWIYLSDAQGEGGTEYSITIPVKARPMPETYDAEVSGEFDDVVRQVSEYAETAQTAADNAGASATAAAASADSAAASASAAETAKTAAQTAQGKAEDAQAAAETAAQTATEKAQQTAQDAAQAAQSKADAESAAGRAEAAQTGAESAKTDAETAAQGAAASASAASASATSAGQAASAADQSATAAAQSAASIEGDVQTATQKAAEATSAAGQAVTAKDAAQTAQQGAETSATNAGQSASTATAKAAEAATSASNAAASESAAEAAATRAEQAAATLTVDDELSDSSENPVQNKVVTGELTDVKSDLSDIAKEIIPTNYASVSTENLIIGTSGLSGKVTASDTDDGVSLINTAGVNGTVGFELAELPYGSSIPLDFFVTVTNAVSPISIDIRRSVTSERPGVVISSLALSDGVYKLENWIPSTFNHDTYGNIFLGYNLRYNQRSPVEITLSVKRHGAVQKTVIKNSALENIDSANLSSELKDAITIVSGKKPTEYGGKQICTFNKGVAIGDSLTAGVFNYSGGATTIANFSFPAKIGQLTGIDMTNLGNGGKTSVDWYALHSADNLSGYQFAIIQLGVNDAMQYNGWTQDSIDAFTNIINKLLEENNGIFVFVSTIIPATSYMGEKYNAVSEGIRNLVETLNNNHVILLDMAQYAHTGDAVGYNNGHLSALGYERLALDYISYISYVISQNLTLFRNIQFIGTNYTYP